MPLGRERFLFAKKLHNEYPLLIRIQYGGKINALPAAGARSKKGPEMTGIPS